MVKILQASSSVSKESACNAGDPGSIPGWERYPGEGNGDPLQYSCLENPMDRGAWQLPNGEECSEEVANLCVLTHVCVDVCVLTHVCVDSLVC